MCGRALVWRNACGKIGVCCRVVAQCHFGIHPTGILHQQAPQSSLGGFQPVKRRHSHGCDNTTAARLLRQRQQLLVPFPLLSQVFALRGVGLRQVQGAHTRLLSLLSLIAQQPLDAMQLQEKALMEPHVRTKIAKHGSNFFVGVCATWPVMIYT